MSEREYASMQEWWDSLSDTERQQKMHHQRQWARKLLLHSIPGISEDGAEILAEKVRLYLYNEMMR